MNGLRWRGFKRLRFKVYNGRAVVQLQARCMLRTSLIPIIGQHELESVRSAPPPPVNSYHPATLKKSRYPVGTGFIQNSDARDALQFQHTACILCHYLLSMRAAHWLIVDCFFFSTLNPSYSRAWYCDARCSDRAHLNLVSLDSYGCCFDFYGDRKIQRKSQRLMSLNT